MPFLTIMAKIKAKQNAAEKVCEELLKLIAPTCREKGCVDYIIHQDLEDPSIIMLYENWENSEDLNVHMNTKHFKDCFAEIEGLYEIEVHRLTKIS